MRLEIQRKPNGPWELLQPIDPQHALLPKSRIKRAKLALMRWQDNYVQYRDAKFRILGDDGKVIS